MRINYILGDPVGERLSELYHAEGKAQGIRDLFPLGEAELEKLAASLDRKALDDLEGRVNVAVAMALDIGFAVGWQCAKQPELLIFEERKPKRSKRGKAAGK